MKCITTITNTIGASRVCVMRDGGSSSVHDEGSTGCEELENKTTVAPVTREEVQIVTTQQVFEGGVITTTPVTTTEVIDGGGVQEQHPAGEYKPCDYDHDCQKYGRDFRCIPDIYECKLSYGDCEDGCECMERHKGTNMKCITTVTNTVGASRVCVMRDTGSSVPDAGSGDCEDLKKKNTDAPEVALMTTPQIFEGGVVTTPSVTNVVYITTPEVIEEGALQRQDNDGRNEFCSSDQECRREGEDYRCIPGSYRCELSYGDCEDGCECMERHKGAKMECITTITSTIGASKVCVMRDSSTCEEVGNKGKFSNSLI